MTTWPDENGEGDDEFEFYDPTSVSPDPDVASGAAPEATESVVAGVAELNDEGGAADPTGAIVAWFDDDRRLQKIKISNRWRERLAKQNLDEALLTLLRSGQASTKAPLWDPQHREEPANTALSAEALERLVEQSAQLDVEARELRAREDVTPTRFVGEDVHGASGNTMVEVDLDALARTTKVTINEKWAKNAKAGDLRDAILQAHQAAYAAWTPPEVVPGDWDLLNAKRTEIRNEIMAMFKHGL